jgi:two-component system LytT family response regulator
MPERSLSVKIIDDEKNSCELLTELLKEIPEIETILHYTDPFEGIFYLKKDVPDMLFLDMNMPGVDGTEILQIIENENIHVHVIIITAYEETIVKAAHFSTIDYLLKPFSFDALKYSIEKYWLHEGQHIVLKNIRDFNNKIQSKIQIPNSFEELFFFPEEIVYLEADGNYTNIITQDRIITSSFHLGRIQKSLPSNHFLRVSRKIIINYMYLCKIDKKNKICVLNISQKKIYLPYSKLFITKHKFLS